MTFGQLFMIMNPNIKVKENRTCYWLYFDESNHHTFSTEWWEKEIPGMIGLDVEKIVKAFDDAKELVWADDDEYTVGYNNGLEAGKNIALAPLKEQEPVEPIPPKYESDLWRCGNCNHQLFRAEHEKYCPNCGRAVKLK